MCIMHSWLLMLTGQQAAAGGTRWLTMNAAAPSVIMLSALCTLLLVAAAAAPASTKAACGPCRRTQLAAPAARQHGEQAEVLCGQLLALPVPPLLQHPLLASPASRRRWRQPRESQPAAAAGEEPCRQPGAAQR